MSTTNKQKLTNTIKNLSANIDIYIYFARKITILIVALIENNY
jgi:hypothetical protein